MQSTFNLVCNELFEIELDEVFEFCTSTLTKKELFQIFSIRIELVLETVRLYADASILFEVSIAFFKLATASVRLLPDDSILDPLKFTVYVEVPEIFSTASKNLTDPLKLFDLLTIEKENLFCVYDLDLKCKVELPVFVAVTVSVKAFVSVVFALKREVIFETKLDELTTFGTVKFISFILRVIVALPVI